MKKIGLSWEANKVYDFKNYVIPGRPSPSEIKINEEVILRLKKKMAVFDVAILGSTVEFRSLCHKHGLKVTVIDFKREHYDVLSEQPMKYKGKEILREEDWRSMKTNKKYDLILGDLVLNLGSLEDILKILKNTCKSLTNDGYAVIRSWVRRGNKRYNVNRVLTEHRKKRPETHIYTSCVMPFYMCYYDFTHDQADYKAMIKGLEKKAQEGRLSKKDYDYLYSRWRHEGTGFTIPSKKMMEKWKSRYFRISRIRYGTDCFSRWAPIYILRKKA